MLLLFSQSEPQYLSNHFKYNIILLDKYLSSMPQLCHWTLLEAIVEAEITNIPSSPLSALAQ